MTVYTIKRDETPDWSSVITIENRSTIQVKKGVINIELDQDPMPAEGLELKRAFHAEATKLDPGDYRVKLASGEEFAKFVIVEFG